MTQKITAQSDPAKFTRLCEQYGIGYTSTVHHFEQDDNGTYQPVLWSEVKLDKQATERTLKS
jgi:hypothetical protein